jgi:AcrR family transcriptional regulator
MEKALLLFAVHGYEGVSVAQIAGAVGIKAPSLYKHYKNKQEIFDTILLEVTNRMINARNKLAVPIDSGMVSRYEQITPDELTKMCFNLFSFYIEDEIVSGFRKMLIVERYRNTEADELYQRFFINGPLEMEVSLFTELINRGRFINGDPRIMALHFYSPLFLLMSKFDNGGSNTDELKDLISRLVHSFTGRYWNDKYQQRMEDHKSIPEGSRR